MSPILARLAARSSFRGVQQQQRTFSVYKSLRQFARSFEHAPFERLPATSESAAADWGRQFKRLGKQSAIYVPAIGMILGWPYLAARGLDGHI
ncbi:hypothetical protein QBC40DRAFT_83059 [Triangularia verruculosa]|uniref:Pantothenate transporter liz1 n=1 Tax=Triangularia verruculosa TaxID=2587418 RepID=A0AAN6XF23_9PEZI|nr:hypothetical protein QBC40DRAFT_83059 [Triangularia verruculosa]